MVHLRFSCALPIALGLPYAVMYLSPAKRMKITAIGNPSISKAWSTIFKRSQKLLTARGFSTLQGWPPQLAAPP
jgi:hypothetical protein